MKWKERGFPARLPVNTKYYKNVQISERKMKIWVNYYTLWWCVMNEELNEDIYKDHVMNIKLDSAQPTDVLNEITWQRDPKILPSVSIKH